MINDAFDKTTIHNFSAHLFWDVDKNDIEMEKDYKFIIKKVLIYGMLSDLKLINRLYGVEKIAKTAIDIRELDKKTLSFISLFTNTPIKEFRCYNTELSIQRHWNF